MRVSRLEIFGFKSFLERLVVPLDSGITGVVGPNGCGKSNIVDALRWVLGETKAKNLRGGVLEDIIFNGTDTLRPLGLAEVTLTLRAAGQNFFEELMSPELEAEHVAVNEILGEPLADTEIEEEEEEEGHSETTDISSPTHAEVHHTGERPHLTVIPGNLDREPGEKAESAPAKPSASLSLLAKFSWLRSASEVQITRRLYRSGESEFFINRVACRLKDIKELFRAVGISARSYTIVAQGEVSRIISARPEERRVILEEAAGVLGFRDKIATASRRLEETELNLSRIDDVMKEVSRQVSSLSRQASRARNRERLRHEIATKEKALFREQFIDFEGKRLAAGQQESELEEREQKIDAELHRVQAEEHEARSELMSLDVEGDAARSKIDALREELSTRARMRADKHILVNERKAFIESARGEIKRLGERGELLAQRLKQAQEEIARLMAQDKELTDKVRGIEGGGAQTLQGILSELDKLRDDLRQKEKQQRELREELISKESSLAAMEAQLVANSPVNQLRNTLGDEQWKSVTQDLRELAPFIDGLTIPSKYAAAVGAVLREQAEFLIADDPHVVGRKFMAQILRGRENDGHGCGIGVFRAGVSTRVNDPHVPLRRLRDEIVADARSEAAANRMFQNTYVVDTLEEAFDYFERTRGPKQVVVVTLNGDIVTEESFVSLRSEGGLVQLRDKAQEHKVRCGELRAALGLLDGDCARVKQELTDCERRYTAALKESEERHSQVRDLSGALGSVRGQLESARTLVQQIEQDYSAVTGQRSELEASAAGVETELTRLEHELSSLVEEADDGLKNELKELQTGYIQIDERRKLGRERLSACSDAVINSRAEQDQVRADISQCKLEFQKEEMLLDNLREKIRNDYGEGVLNEVFSSAAPESRLSDDARAAYQEEVSALKARIAREGDVDPSSIEQYEQEKTRLDDLATQREDLESAAATLKKTIERLSETSEKRFIATFEAVRNNFGRLVPRLFGGGKATIELLDPAHPLESGVEIIARPPGKKLKSIELLSGGEKALCATALIFSMFLERPSPLCVLDEVDAPLDDANVVRFLTLIREMSSKTQFMVVTHNKQSMAVADKLIGVTMQEPGASKVINVTLQEAYSQVA